MKTVSRFLETLLQFTTVYVTALIVGVAQIAAVDDPELQQQLLRVLRGSTMILAGAAAFLAFYAFAVMVSESRRPHPWRHALQTFLRSSIALALALVSVQTIMLAESRLTLPDLSVGRMYSSLDNPPWQDHAGLVTYIDNSGQITSEPCSVQLTWTDPEGEVHTHQQWLEEPIEAGRSKPVFWDHSKGEVRAGQWTFYVIVDPDDAVQEFDEHNNTLREAVPIAPPHK